MEPTPTLSSLSGLWLKECEGLIFPETIRIYAIMMQDHILPRLGDRLSFTQEEVKDFLDGKLAAGMAEEPHAQDCPRRAATAITTTACASTGNTQSSIPGRIWSG